MRKPVLVPPAGLPGKRRRGFLLAGLAAGGALLIGWGTQPPRQRLHPAQPLRVADDEVALNGWVALAPDGSVSVVVPRSEMGQGVHTAARIGAAADKKEILVSRETLDGIGTAFRLSEPRAEELKGFDQPVEVVSVAWQ